MQTTHELGDLVKFFDNNGTELLGIITGNTLLQDKLKVSTLDGTQHKLSPDQVILTMGNYFDGPQMQRAIRTIAHIKQ